ncbi:hypothetical protein C8R45DRAFT_529594 [Mycena sanguinolenta]|nr:hypothetical protein C8R45DRAFT_529594 [Mycena sanguinolenta]
MLAPHISKTHMSADDDKQYEDYSSVDSVHSESSFNSAAAQIPRRHRRRRRRARRRRWRCRTRRLRRRIGRSSAGRIDGPLCRGASRRLPRRRTSPLPPLLYLSRSALPFFAFPPTQFPQYRRANAPRPARASAPTACALAEAVQNVHVRHLRVIPAPCAAGYARKRDGWCLIGAGCRRVLYLHVHPGCLWGVEEAPSPLTPPRNASGQEDACRRRCTEGGFRSEETERMRGGDGVGGDAAPL